MTSPVVMTDERPRHSAGGAWPVRRLPGRLRSIGWSITTSRVRSAKRGVLSTPTNASKHCPLSKGIGQNRVDLIGCLVRRPVTCSRDGVSEGVATDGCDSAELLIDVAPAESVLIAV